MADRLFVVDGGLRAHLVLVFKHGLDGYRRLCRANGVAPLPEVDALFTALADESGPWRPHMWDAAEVAEPVCVSYREAARRLGVSERTVRRAVRAGRLPVAELGRRRLVPVAALAEYGRRR